MKKDMRIKEMHSDISEKMKEIETLKEDITELKDEIAAAEADRFAIRSSAKLLSIYEFYNDS